MLISRPDNTRRRLARVGVRFLARICSTADIGCAAVVREPWLESRFPVNSSLPAADPNVWKVRFSAVQFARSDRLD